MLPLLFFGSNLVCRGSCSRSCKYQSRPGSTSKTSCRSREVYWQGQWNQHTQIHRMYCVFDPLSVSEQNYHFKFQPLDLTYGQWQAVREIILHRIFDSLSVREFKWSDWVFLPYVSYVVPILFGSPKRTILSKPSFNQGKICGTACLTILQS